MGGMSSEISRKSKIEVYLEYKEITKNWEGSCHPDPNSKKECKSSMLQDPISKEWVLHFRLHT